MAKSRTVLVPTYVKNLNAIGRAAGFTVEDFKRDKFWPRDESDSLVARWHGSCSEFANLTFLTPMTRHRTMDTSVRRDGLTISWPGPAHCNPKFLAICQISKGNVDMQVSGGPVPIEISTRGSVEIIEYEGETAYHGTREALIQDGICADKHFGHYKKRDVRSKYNDEGPKWKMKRQLNCDFVYWRETDTAFNERMADDASRAKESERNSEEYEAMLDWARRKLDPSYASRAAESDAPFQRFMQSALISQTLVERQTKH